MKHRMKTAVLRIRCEPSWKKEVAQIAYFKDLDTADIVRIALNDYMEKFKSNGKKA